MWGRGKQHKVRFLVTDSLIKFVRNLHYLECHLINSQWQIYLPSYRKPSTAWLEYSFPVEMIRLSKCIYKVMKSRGVYDIIQGWANDFL